MEFWKRSDSRLRKIRICLTITEALIVLFQCFSSKWGGSGGGINESPSFLCEKKGRINVLFPISNLVERDKAIHYGVNSEAGDGMDIEFSEYVLAVGQDRIDRNEEFVCHILVAHAARNANDYFAFAFGERFVILVLLERLSLGSFHQEFYSREEKVVFNAAM